MNWVTIILIKVKSCNALLHLLLLCIGIYLKSVLIYKFYMLDTCRLGTLYYCQQGCEDLWLFFEAKRGPQAKGFGKQKFKGFGKELRTSHVNN